MIPEYPTATKHTKAHTLWHSMCFDVFCCGWIPWWRHQMETFSASLTLCAGNSPVTGEFPTQRPGTRSFDVYFDLRLNKRLKLMISDAIAVQCLCACFLGCTLFSTHQRLVSKPTANRQYLTCPSPLTKATLRDQWIAPTSITAFGHQRDIWVKDILMTWKRFPY